MTTKILSGVYNAGYTLSATFSGVSITGDGLVRGVSPNGYNYDGGEALVVGFVAPIANSGSEIGGAGAEGSPHSQGGTGGRGITTAGGSLVNAYFVAGGEGGNGGAKGGSGGAGGAAVSFGGSGAVSNGDLLQGGAGGAGADQMGYGAGGAGGAGGLGVDFGASSGSGTVSNTGIVKGGAGGAGGAGNSPSGGDYRGGQGGLGGGAVRLGDGGSVSNSGQVIGGAGGTGGGYSPGYGDGGNGGSGAVGAVLDGGGRVTNSGLIEGGAGGAGGKGSAFDSASVVSHYGGDGGDGGVGLVLSGGGSVFNTGQIIGGAAGAGGHSTDVPGAAGGVGYGIDMVAGGRVTNGATTATGALIKGAYGIYAGTSGAATVTNFGTIQATAAGAKSVWFGSSADRLIAETGSKLIGVAFGGGGTLVVAGGHGTIALGVGLGVLTGDVTLECESFADLVLDPGASWILTGPAKLGSADAVANLTIKDQATLGAQGSIANAGVISLVSAGALTELRILAAGATLSGGGRVTLSGADSRIVGAAGATLTNVNDTLSGAGFIGTSAMSLVNEAGGVILGNQTTALVINTGTHAIINAGTIENSGKGGALVRSAVVNNGILEAAGTGTLTLAGAVSGTGVGRITGGTLWARSTFVENVTFTGTTGVLELANSTAYTGRVKGLSTSGTNSLDLTDIAFTSGVTKATFSGTSSAGTLTVTDGAHTAHIKLVGDYLGSTFTVSGDGHGGTTVVDPALAILAHAMAGFRAGAPPGPAECAGRTAPPPLALAHG
jgi:hypothetical protein